MTKEPFLGILQVDTTFHRPVGDVGNIQTWKIPIRIKIVGNTKDDVVKSSKKYDQSFVDAWINAANELICEGAIAIITSCGFLATIHPILQSKLSVPVGTSSLLQISLAQNLIPKGKKLGIITFDSDNLGSEHLKAVNINYDVPIVGVVKNGNFQRIIRNGQPYDYAAIENEVVNAAQKLIDEYENIGGIVLECTNMPPFKRSIYKKIGLPIWDIITLGNYLYSVALPETYN